MFEYLLHLIGICPDSLTHPNLINLLGLGLIFSVLRFFKNKFISLKNKFFKKDDKKG